MAFAAANQDDDDDELGDIDMDKAYEFARRAGDASEGGGANDANKKKKKKRKVESFNAKETSVYIDGVGTGQYLLLSSHT